MRTPRPLATLFGALLLSGAVATASAQPQAAAAHELKALVVLRSLLFVEWPPAQLAPEQPLQLCLLDDGPLGRALLGMSGQQVGRHGLKVRQVGAGGLAGCHVAVVGAARDWGPVPESTLLVSDAPGMLQHGVMLNLQVEDGRVVFDIELGAVRRAGLDISAKLLRLARFVRTERHAG